jgi:hypothetical protein
VIQPVIDPMVRLSSAPRSVRVFTIAEDRCRVKVAEAIKNPVLLSDGSLAGD